MNQFIEILFFAALAFYLFYRLWSVLGTRTGNEKPPIRDLQDVTNQEKDNVIPLPNRSTPRQIRSLSPDDSMIEEPFQEEEEFPEIEKVKKVYPDFNLSHFLGGAEKAYMMIIEAFSKGDRQLLKQLLSADVYKKFVKAIVEREKSGTTLKTEIQDISSTEVVSADIEGKKLKISVKFVSEQMVATMNSNGQIMDNPAQLSVPMTDIWTFSHDLGHEDPNWVLIATRSVDV